MATKFCGTELEEALWKQLKMAAIQADRSIPDCLSEAIKAWLVRGGARKGAGK